MNRVSRRRPSAALIVAMTALFVALGGTSYAAFSLPKNSVGTKQLRNRAVTTRKIKNGAVTASKINTAGLTVPNALHADAASSATIAGTAAPSGAAGGALAGSYPSPTIASGAVTPAMMGPIPAAVVTNSGDVSVIGGGAQNLINFDTNQVNIDGIHSTSSDPSRLTAPIDGLYAVHGEANWFPCSNTGTFEEIEIFLNNSTRVGVTEIPNSSAACVVEGVSALVRMHAGDYVQLYARQSSGSTETIRGTTAEGAPDTPEFDMRWVAPS